MGFVKGVVTGVIAVAGVVVGAAVVSVIKDERIKTNIDRDFHFKVISLSMVLI